jgi:hypothetical protein
MKEMTKKWIVRLSGGIGNQLFMYAFAKYIESVCHKDVYMDCMSYRRSNLRKPEILSIFPSIKRHDLFLNDVALRGGVKYVMSCLMKLLSHYTIYDTGDAGCVDIKDLCGDKEIYFTGFHQTGVYVDWLKKNNLFADIFAPRQDVPDIIKFILNEISLSENPVSVHVRRGDYVEAWARDKYLVCTSGYYQEAIRKLQRGNVRFFVFSDDVDWVRKNIPLPDNTFFVTDACEVNTYWYIWLMSKCKHNIISNSTFSWWGAYLNENKEKIVVAPSLWQRGTEFTLNQEGWVVIDVK